MDMITVSAKTVDEAVTKALIELKTTSDKLEYEVVEEGSKGFLGLGAKPAVIRAKKKETVADRAIEFLEKFSKMRPSATTMSPASSSTMSPGTTWAEGITVRMPSRSTLALGADMAFRLSRDFSALKCWTVPSTALRSSTAKMTTVLSPSPETRETRAATIRMTTSRSLNCSKNTCTPVFFFPSARAFLP